MFTSYRIVLSRECKEGNKKLMTCLLLVVDVRYSKRSSLEFVCHPYN